jgi:hypothetical protein
LRRIVTHTFLSGPDIRKWWVCGHSHRITP